MAEQFSIFMYFRDIKLGLNQKNELIVSDEKEKNIFNIGAKSQADIKELKFFLDRLSIHMPKH
jgi:hypothetical protein